MLTRPFSTSAIPVPHVSPPGFPGYGGHLALDFLNTAPLFLSDHSVRNWLRLADEEFPSHIGELLDAAWELETVTQSLIEKRKAGMPADPSALNAFLARGLGRLALEWPADGCPTLKQRRPWDKAADVLLPVAEAIADLLANGDFELVRRCERKSCRLWFYDRTKSHRRRWCHSGTCGNRAKVAAWRTRNDQNAHQR